MSKRIYLVSEGTGDVPEKQFLVNAANQSQAIQAIAKPRFKAVIPTPAELIALTKKGVELVEG